MYLCMVYMALAIVWLSPANLVIDLMFYWKAATVALLIYQYPNYLHDLAMPCFHNSDCLSIYRMEQNKM